MVGIDWHLIQPFIGPWMLIIARLSGFMLSTVAFSRSFLPRPVKAGFIVALSIAFMPSINIDEAPTFALNFSFGLQIAEGLLIGVLIGFAGRFLVQLYAQAAQLIAMQIGLGFASFIDPNSGSVPLLSQFWVVVVTLIWFAMDGHLIFLQAMHMSFIAIPLGQTIWGQIDWMHFAEFGKYFFLGSLMVAMAIVLALLLVHASIAMLSRAAPQFNLFSLGFPLTLLIGLFFIWLMFEVIALQFVEWLPFFLDHSCRGLQFSCVNDPGGL